MQTMAAHYFEGGLLVHQLLQEIACQISDREKNFSKKFFKNDYLTSYSL
jgi:hypothetical protein